MWQRAGQARVLTPRSHSSFRNSHFSSHCLFVLCFRNVVFVNPDRNQCAVDTALSIPFYLSLEKFPSVCLEAMSYRHLG